MAIRPIQAIALRRSDIVSVRGWGDRIHCESCVYRPRRHQHAVAIPDETWHREHPYSRPTFARWGGRRKRTGWGDRRQSVRMWWVVWRIDRESRQMDGLLLNSRLLIRDILYQYLSHDRLITAFSVHSLRPHLLYSYPISGRWSIYIVKHGIFDKCLQICILLTHGRSTGLVAKQQRRHQLSPVEAQPMRDWYEVGQRQCCTHQS